MRILKEGDRGTALAEERGRVEVEYRYQELELDSGVRVPEVLVGVDPATGKVLTVPAQSEPRIRDARIAVKEEVLEVRVPRPLEDILELLAHRYGARASRFAPALIRYYLARAAREPQLVTRMVRLAASELAGGSRVGRLRVRCRPDVIESVDGLLEGLEGVSRSDLVRGAILAAKEDLLDGGDRPTERSVRAIAAAV